MVMMMMHHRINFTRAYLSKYLHLGSYYMYWSYKCFDPYFLDQPVVVPFIFRILVQYETVLLGHKDLLL